MQTHNCVERNPNVVKAAVAAGRTKYKVIGMKAAKRNKKPQPSAQLGEDDDASSRETSFSAAAVMEIAEIVSLCKACIGLSICLFRARNSLRSSITRRLTAERSGCAAVAAKRE